MARARTDLTLPYCIFGSAFSWTLGAAICSGAAAALSPLVLLILAGSLIPLDRHVVHNYVRNPTDGTPEQKLQQTTLSHTRMACYFTASAVSTAAGVGLGSSFPCGIGLGMGLTIGPLGWIALGFVGVGALAIHQAAGYKKANPGNSLFGYDSNNHYNVTNSLYKLFDKVGSVVGFYTLERVSPSPNRQAQ